MLRISRLENDVSMNYYRSDNYDERVVAITVADENSTPQYQTTETTSMAHFQDLIPLEEHADVFHLFAGKRRCHEITLRIEADDTVFLSVNCK